MVEVIPSINAEVFEEIQRKIRFVEPYVEWVHIDVYDGTFTEYTSWHNASDLLSLDTSCSVEVHLMITDMDIRYADWLLPNISRIIFHAEAAHDPHLVIEKIHEGKKEAGVAIRPETDWRALEPFCEKADLVQTLAVPPGHAGQEFRQETVEKVANIRKACPNCIIEVDGGINPETGGKCVEAGANILVAAKYIFSSSNIEQALKDLNNASSH